MRTGINTPANAFSRKKRIISAAASAAVMGMLLAGCATGTATTTESSSGQSSGMRPGGSAAAAVENVVPAADAAAIALAAPESTESIAVLAEAFAETLDADQLVLLQQEYSLANAAKWSNLPQALLQGEEARIGVQLATLTEEQLTALDTLLKAATGTGVGEGWDELQQIWNADDYLTDNGGGTDYGRGNYFVAFLGAPSDSGTWELQFGGHHFALANTYTDGTLAGATPSFRAVEPFGSFEVNDATNEPIASEQEAFAALVGSLTEDQVATAELADVYTDILLGPSDDWVFPAEKEGIQGSDLTDEQRTLAMEAIATYVEDLDDADAATILAKYESELDETYISFSGSSDVTEQDDYVRIDGPSVWIEFSMQAGIVLDGNHPHSVWRDRTTDYGGTQS